MNENELLSKGFKLAALEDLQEREKAAALNAPIVIDVTGTPLTPGHPKTCLGSGDFPGFPLCCDECNFLVDCAAAWGDEFCIELKKKKKL